MSVIVKNAGGGAKVDINYAAYATFVSGRTGDELDAMFGKNNEDKVKGIGLALAMYAKYKDPAIDIETNFPNLITCVTLNDLTKQSALEIINNDDLYTLFDSSDYAISKLGVPISVASKSDKSIMEMLLTKTQLIDGIRTGARALFNKNRIRILAPGDVSWTVPDDWPTNFIHVQLIGGGGDTVHTKGNSYASVSANCGEYKQFILDVVPGQVITGSIGAPNTATANSAHVTFGGQTATCGAGAVQEGSFLVKGKNGGGTFSGQYSGSGFEGGDGGYLASYPQYGGTGDMTLGECEGTGGASSAQGMSGSNGSGGTYIYDNNNSGAGGGGGGYGGAGATIYSKGNGTKTRGGSGAIIISCPDGYIPEFVVYNTIGGVTAWRRDENIFNDFGENA